MNSRPLRILTVANVPSDPNSGAAGTVYQTNVALRELGHDVDEVWSDQLGPRRISHGNLHSLLEQPRMYRTAVRTALARASRPYDVIQMSQPQSWLAAYDLKRSGFKGVVINRSHGLELRGDSILPGWHRKLNVPESRFPRSLFTPLLRYLLQRQWSKTIRYHDGVILTCELDRDFLIERLPNAASRSFVVHHGVSPAFVETPLRAKPLIECNRVLSISQHAFFKGFHVLCRVINQAFLQNSQLQMTWVTSQAGHAELRSLLNTDVQQRVQLLDWRTQDELIRLYDENDCFVFPSLFEGAGKASLEAMSRQMYVIASDTGGMRDYIKPTQAGKLCPVGDVSAFAAAILDAVSNPTMAQQAAQRAREVAITKTWQANAMGLVDVYRQLGAFRS